MCSAKRNHAIQRTSKTISFLLCFVIALQFLPKLESEAASDSSDYKILGSIGGPTTSAAEYGNYLYVGKGSSILILEAGGKLNQTGKQVNLPSFVSDLKVDGNMLYAAAGSAGLHIFDITDPLAPVEKGVYETTGFAEAIAVNKATIYMANGLEGLQLIDVSDPTKPVALGQAWKGKYVFHAVVKGIYAYLAASEDGLLITDISQSTAPRELASFNTPGIARSLAVSDQYAFVADDWKGVSVIDISNPASPLLKKTLSTAGRAHGVALDRDYLYVADAYMGLRVFNMADISAPVDVTSFIPESCQMLRLLAGTNQSLYGIDRDLGILAFDMTKPEAPKLKSFYSYTIPVPLTSSLDFEYYDFARSHKKEIKSLMVLGIIEEYPDHTLGLRNDITRADLAVIICKTLKLKKVKQGKTPVFKDLPTSNPASGYAEAAVKSGYMQVKSDRIFAPEDKVTNQEALGLMLKMTGNEAQTVDAYLKAGDRYGFSVLLSGKLGQNISRAGLFVLLNKTITEVSNPKTKITLLQSKFGITCQAFQTAAVQVAVKDNYAFVTSGTGDLTVVDVSNPECPVLAAKLSLPEMLSFISIRGSYAYLPAVNYLFTIDISDPLHPVCISKIEIYANESPRSMDMDQDRIYIADEGVIKVFSIKDPARPVLLTKDYVVDHTSGNEAGDFTDIDVKNNIAHMATQFEGIYIYDISNPNDWKKLGWYKSNWGFVANMDIIGNYAYVNCPGGIEIYDVTDMKNPIYRGIIENVKSQNFVYRMDTYENIALLPNDASGIMLADISVPGQAKPIMNLDTLGMAEGVTVYGDKAYIADGIGGMVIAGLTKTVPQVTSDTSIGSSASGNACTVNNSIFKGLPAEKYVLSSDKALTALKNRNKNYTETLTVTNTNADGEGSLSQCVFRIKDGGCITFDTKVFNPEKPATIYLDQGMGFFQNHNITIDASNAGVILDGSRSSDGRGLTLATNGNAIMGVKFQNFSNLPLNITGADNIVGGNRAVGKGPSGEGNVVVHSLALSINGANATGNIVVGNYIGIEADGITPNGNIGGGIDLRGPVSINIIGIDKPEYRNIVCECKDRGISAMGGSYGNLFEGNYSGTDITGTAGLGNTYQHGISLELGPFGNIIRNNVCCDNGRAGILMGDLGSNFNVIVSNNSGLGANGKTLLPNHQMGAIFVYGDKGAGNCFNIIGGKDEKLKNKLAVDRTAEIGFDCGIYETICNGVVYKNTDRTSY